MITALLVSVLVATTPENSVEKPPRTFPIDWTADWEVGPLYVFRNDQRYGENGRWFGAKEMGEQRAFLAAQRASLELKLSKRHMASLLYAPVDIRSQAQLGQDLTFRDTTFAAGSNINFRYLFDGWRATYLYLLAESKHWEWSVGAAIQIRSASVELALQNGEQFVYESDIGIVPTLSTRLKYTRDDGVYAMLDATGSYAAGFGGGGSGGVLDAALTLGIPLNVSTDMILRLRQYGGGAIVPNRDIGNWGWFSSAAIGLRVNLSKLGQP